MDLRISRLSLALQWLCRAALVALPVLVLSFAVLAVRDPALIARQLSPITLTGAPSPAMLSLVILLLMLPQAVPLYVLWQLEILFGLYRRGETLTRAPALRIRRIGLGVAALAPLSVLIRPVAGLLLTLANPPGERQLSVGLSSSDIGLVLAGGLLVVIGWIMGEAARIAEENRGFV